MLAPTPAPWATRSRRRSAPARRSSLVLALCCFVAIGCSVNADDVTTSSAIRAAAPSHAAQTPQAAPTPDPRTATLDALMADPRIGAIAEDSLLRGSSAHLGNGGGTIRIYTHGAYRVEGIEDVTYIFEPNGDVLEIKVGNIFARASTI